MILELLFDFALWLFGLLCEAFPAAQPTVYGISSAISAVIDTGVWVIGENTWQLVMSVISSWLGFRFTAGIVLFVYRLIPFNS